MRRALPLLLLLGCGPSYDGPARFDVYLSGIDTSLISGFQISVLSERKTVDCAEVTKGCVKDQFPASRFVPLQDATGATVDAIRVQLTADGGVQPAVLSMSPGKDFAFVIEAFTKASTPQLAGSSCTYVPEITAGSNTVNANAISIPDGGVTAFCDPRG